MAAKLKAGDRAPDFTARTTDGRTVSLADYAGRYLVIYFYPKAFTPGCTRETIRFRESYDAIRELGADVLGVSIDAHETQCEFAEKYEVQFPLAGDEERTMSRAFGVLRWPIPVDKRVTYIIDPEGRIVARFHHELRVDKHVDEVVKFLRARIAAA